MEVGEAILELPWAFFFFKPIIGKLSESDPAVPSLPLKLSNQPVEIEPGASQEETAASYIRRKERAKKGKHKTIS